MSDATTTTDKPGDPADKAADGAFGGVHSHRAGYGDDKLQRVMNWLRERPLATLASGEGGLLLAEIDRLTDKLNMACRDRDITHAAAQSFAKDRDRADRILAALREPSDAVVQAVKDAIYEELGIEYWDGKTRRILYYAVAAAEREVDAWAAPCV